MKHLLLKQFHRQNKSICGILKKDRDNGFCPFLLLCFRKGAFKDANGNRRSDPPTVAVVRQYATPACWRGGGSLRRLGERSEPYKPPLSNKGGTKNKSQYTLTSGKRCIYKAKPLLTGC